MKIIFDSSQERAIVIIIAIILVTTVVVKVAVQTHRAYQSDEITYDTVEKLDSDEKLRPITEEEQRELQRLLDLPL